MGDISLQATTYRAPEYQRFTREEWKRVLDRETDAAKARAGGSLKFVVISHIALHPDDQPDRKQWDDFCAAYPADRPDVRFLHTTHGPSDMYGLFCGRDTTLGEMAAAIGKK